MKYIVYKRRGRKLIKSAKRFFKSQSRERLITVSLLCLAFLVVSGSALAAMTFGTDTITGSGALNLNPTTDPVTVNGDLTVTGTCTGCGGGGSGSPGGAVSSIQYNNTGSFGGFGTFAGGVFATGVPTSMLSLDAISADVPANIRTYFPAPSVSGLTGPVLAGDGAGNVDNGVHSYKFTWSDSDGHVTLPSSATPTVTVVDKSADGKVTVALPYGCDTTMPNLGIYRTAAGGSVYKLVEQQEFECATSYTDNTADADLGADAPATDASLKTRFAFSGETLIPPYSSDWGGYLMAFPGDASMYLTMPDMTAGHSYSPSLGIGGSFNSYGDGGGVYMYAGGGGFNTAGFDGNGGSLQLGSGYAYGSGYTSGAVTISTGAGYRGAQVNAISLQGGDSTDSQAGSIGLTAGSDGGNGSGGWITLTVGASDSGSPGGIAISKSGDPFGGILTIDTYLQRANWGVSMAFSQFSPLSVSSTTANSCGTSDPSMVSNSTNNAGAITVGATSGTSCTLDFTVAAPTAYACSVNNETTANLVRAVRVDTDTVKFVGTFVGGDVLNYTCFGY